MVLWWSVLPDWDGLVYWESVTPLKGNCLLLQYHLQWMWLSPIQELFEHSVQECQQGSKLQPMIEHHVSCQRFMRTDELQQQHFHNIKASIVAI